MIHDMFFGWFHIIRKVCLFFIGVIYEEVHVFYGDFIYGFLVINFFIIFGLLILSHRYHHDEKLVLIFMELLYQVMVFILTVFRCLIALRKSRVDS